MSASEKEGLQRTIGLSGLAFYGAGTILGAGIFVVVGEAVAEAGALSPLAYAFAGLVAMTTALSFAELGARIPTAGGPIDYTEKAFGRSDLAGLTGWILTIANIVSGATITTGFVSYLGSFTDVPSWIGTTGLVLTLGVISIAGMKQSTLFMTITTIVGVLTLLVILWARREAVMASPSVVVSAVGNFDGAALAGLYAGAFLAFYSFIGFGDMAQTAEETKNVAQTLPRAIVIAMIVVFAFYLLISAALVGGDDIDQIVGSQAPLVKAAQLQGYPGLPIAIASLFVIVNGALTQVITAARLLLDLGRDERGAPAFLGKVNISTNTPIIATLVVLAAVLLLALFVPLKGLASATSLAVLIVFVGVNASLVKLKQRSQPEGVPDVPVIIPRLGTFLSGLAIVGQCVLWVLGGGGS